jgi:dTDP-4-amino-4,6-dideoxygalactose transaminase
MTVSCGAVPVFADIISLDEPTIDPREVEALLTPRTKAVVAMHYGGNLCRMFELAALCRRHKISLIEDACHAVGVAYEDSNRRPPHGVMAGSIGEIGAFSFFSNKNIASGEGGMVVTDHDDLAEQIRLLRSHGMTTLTWDRYTGHAKSYDVVVNGFNYRLDDLRAAIARTQLAKLSRHNQRRRELLELYRDGVQSLPGWSMPFADRIKHSSGHLIVVVAPTSEAKDKAVHALREARIQSSLHYPCIADLKAFQGLSTRGLENTRKFTQHAVTLPLYPTLSTSGVMDTIRVISAAAV